AARTRAPRRATLPRRPARRLVSGLVPVRARAFAEHLPRDARQVERLLRGQRRVRAGAGLLDAHTPTRPRARVHAPTPDAPAIPRGRPQRGPSPVRPLRLSPRRRTRRQTRQAT